MKLLEHFPNKNEFLVQDARRSRKADVSNLSWNMANAKDKKYAAELVEARVGAKSALAVAHDAGNAVFCCKFSRAVATSLSVRALPHFLHFARSS